MHLHKQYSYFEKKRPHPIAPAFGGYRAREGEAGRGRRDRERTYFHHNEAGKQEGRMSMSQSDDEEEEEHCPLCCETLDITDRNFFPCPCEYQVCIGVEGMEG